MTAEQLTEILQRRFTPDFREQLEIVRRNSRGKIWVIGGFVYKTLASELYGREIKTKDVDFLVENPNPEIVLPEGWKITLNHFGNPKFIPPDGKEKPDFVPLARVYSILKRRLPPEIENYLSGTPLNVQSIAYEVDGRIIGDAGISALEKRVVAVHNLDMAKDVAYWIYNKTVNDIIKKAADELGFQAEYPN